MAQFLTAVALDPTKVTCRRTISVSISALFLRLTCLCRIDSGDRGGAFLLPLPLIISAAVSLIFPPSFCGRLRFFYPVVSKVLSEEILKLRPRYRVLGFGATLMLVPLLGNCSVEKRGGEQNAVGPVGPSSFEMIFTLLAKTVAVKM